MVGDMCSGGWLTLCQVALGVSQLDEDAVRRGNAEGEQVGEWVHPVVRRRLPHGINDLQDTS